MQSKANPQDKFQDQQFSLQKKDFVRKNDIAMYIPNIIDYARIFLVVISAPIFSVYPDLWVALYFTSYLLDALDGITARYFEQTSKYGSFLDMITDRMGYLSFTFLLVKQHSPLTNILIIWEIVDVASHWNATVVAAINK